MKKPIAIKKASLAKKVSFDASPVSRKEVEAMKAKLREKANKSEALKVAKAELKAEKKDLQKKAHTKLLEALYRRSKTLKK